MTLEEAVVAHLRWYDAEILPLVGQVRIYPAIVPEEVTEPALAYEVTSDDEGMSHSGGTGLFIGVVAIYCTVTGAEKYATAKALGEAVRVALEYPTWTWGSMQVARKHATVSSGEWSQETQSWTVTVTVTVNHMG